MTATITHTLGRFVWRELFTKDVPAAKRFYTELFGWTTADVPMGPDFVYTLWMKGDKQIGGLMDIADMPEGTPDFPPNWAVYVSVEDVDKAAAIAVAEGGQLLGECHDIPGVGRFAVLADPDGAPISLLRQSAGDGPDGMPQGGEFCWESLQAKHPTKVADFYKKVVGWDTTVDGEGGSQATLFTRQRDGEEVYVATLGEAPEGVPAHWSTYVGVENLEATGEKCRALGGEVIVPRIDVPGYGAFAVFKDPTGAFISAFQPTFE